MSGSSDHNTGLYLKEKISLPNIGGNDLNPLEPEVRGGGMLLHPSDMISKILPENIPEEARFNPLLNRNQRGMLLNPSVKRKKSKIVPEEVKTDPTTNSTQDIGSLLSNPSAKPSKIFSTKINFDPITSITNPYPSYVKDRKEYISDEEEYTF